MKKGKHLIVLCISLFSLLSFAQEKSDLNCAKTFESIETEVPNQKNVSYSIISSQKLYTPESFEFSKGVIIIKDLNEALTPKELVKVVATIGVEHKLSEIIAFKTCKALDLYFQEAKPTAEELDYLKKNIIIELSVDINQSLSKKERKKNKKKRDFIESVAKEICETLSKGKAENFGPEKLSRAMVPKVSENVEKIMKVYDTSFEEGSNSFMQDLTFYLIDNCKIVTDFVKDKK